MNLANLPYMVFNKMIIYDISRVEYTPQSKIKVIQTEKWELSCSEFHLLLNICTRFL